MPEMDDNIDYYAVLGVKQDATEDAVRQAYIKESLKWHPDRNPSTESTARFQQIAQAYFVLSDKNRRTAYDRARREKKRYAAPSEEPVNAEAMFGNVFDDLLVPEVPNPVWFWEPVGGVAGFVVGFIVFNIPGALFGAYTGKKMGKVRDMKGVAVYEAFAKLSKDRKAEILAALAGKFLPKAF
ncbi:DnaJ domain-containing protein [Fimicolochytrium jonesii]|uniref:DnaJ domain-containing protein n=1 Tax=Fimicolochytrium jonesii TaxID=1396493 RepID=UPI0022FEE93F|nr:DnaJ domain-containing protein [Fimicolochytrium jonesii]KAI8818073.1 DnaJ domain-containing protein [Fimicolochytrium jonesii]